MNNVLKTNKKEEGQFEKGLYKGLYKQLDKGLYKSNNDKWDFYVCIIQRKAFMIKNSNKEYYGYKALDHPLCRPFLHTLLDKMENWVNFYAYKFEFMIGNVNDMHVSDVKSIIKSSILKSIYKFDFNKGVRFKTFVQRVAYNDILNELRSKRKYNGQPLIYIDSYETDKDVDFKDCLELQMSSGQKGLEQLIIERHEIRAFNAIYKSLSKVEKDIICAKVDRNVRIDDYCMSVGISRSKYQRDFKKVTEKIRDKARTFN